MIRRLARWMQRRRWWILAYILLLAASNIFVLIPGTDAWTPPDSRVAAGAERIDLEVPAMRDGGAIPERSTTVSVLRWICSFLRGRKIRVAGNGEFSPWRRTRCGAFSTCAATRPTICRAFVLRREPRRSQTGGLEKCSWFS